VSIGKCSLERPLSRFFIRIALRLAQYRSYRDSESKIAMQTLIDVRRDPVYPDLAFSYPCPVVPSEPGAGATDRNLVVGVSPIAYCDPRVWPRPDAQRYAAYLGRLAEMVKWLINEGYRVLFFTTDSPDTAAVDDIKSLLSGSTLDANAIQTLPGSAEQSPDSLLQGLSGVHLTVASRLHGVILSHLSATPVLALSFDPKVDAHMHAMEQQAYCLSIDQLQPVRLIERFKALRALREREAAAIGNAGQAFRRQLDSQYDRLLGAPLSLPIKGAYPRPVEASPRSEWGRVGTR
jgi:polysaccharide pyruvyl transferase WcaK-like protein